MCHLQKSEFQVKALFLLVAQFAVSTQHDLEMPRQILLAKQLRHSRHPRPLVTR